MQSCPKCESHGITMDTADEGVRVYSCMKCGQTTETTEVPSTTLRWLLDRSMHLAQLQTDTHSLEKTLAALN